MTQTPPPYVWPNIAALRATDDPHDDASPATMADRRRLAYHASVRAEGLNARATMLRNIAALQPFSVHVTTLHEIADELAQLAGGVIETKE